MRRFICAALAALYLTIPALAVETLPEESFSLSCTAAVLMERQTGTVLYEKEAHRHLSPASVTKVMTLLPGRLDGRQPGLAGGGRGDDRGGDDQVRGGRLGKRLRRGARGGALRLGGGVRRAHEPPRGGAGALRHALHQLHRSLRGRGALHLRLRYCGHIARAIEARVRPAVYDALAGHDTFR